MMTRCVYDTSGVRAPWFQIDSDILVLINVTFDIDILYFTVMRVEIRATWPLWETQFLFQGFTAT